MTNQINQAWQDFLQQRRVPGDSGYTADSVDNRAVCALTHLGVLSVSGRDAVSFLQGQVTCDVRQVSQTRSSLGAFCNPKGRVLAVFRIIRMGDTFYLLLEGERLPALHKRLQMYVLRADVKLGDQSGQWVLLGLIGALTEPEYTRMNGTPKPFLAQEAEPNTATATAEQAWVQVQTQPDRSLLMTRCESAISFWTALHESGAWCEAGHRPWQQQEIAAGVPTVYDATAEAFVAQMLNLDQLDAISFKKGCYTGQEIIARSHYLGQLKRRLYRFRGNGEVPQPGVLLYGKRTAGANEQSVGQVVMAEALSGLEYELLAVVQTHCADAEVHLGATDGGLLTLQKQ